MTIPDNVAKVNAQTNPGQEPEAFTPEQLEQMRRAITESEQEVQAQAAVETMKEVRAASLENTQGLIEERQMFHQVPMQIPRLALVQQLHGLLENLAVANDATGRLPSVSWEGAEADPEAQIRQAIAEAHDSIGSAYRKILAVAGLLAIGR